MNDRPAAGWLDGRTHSYSLRVYYADTDAGGIVYHATYLDFAERARTEMMRLFGVDLIGLHREHELLFAVRSCEIDYLRSARLDDVLEVNSTLVHLGGASVHVAQSIRRGDEELVRLLIRLVCIHSGGRARRLPASVRDTLQDFLMEEADESHA